MNSSSDVTRVLAALERAATQRDRDNLARFGITAKKAYGVSIANIQRIAKPLGRNHALATALWKTGWYEARLLTAFIDEPERVTPAQMDRWCRDFDSWGIVDTVCFKLFDRTPHAWKKAAEWASRTKEFEKRAGYVLMACLALHDKGAPDKAFLPFLTMIEHSATDGRNFVVKGADWALRSIARRSSTLKSAAAAVSKRMKAARSASRRMRSAKAL